MDKQIVKKVATFSFLAASILTYIVVNTLFQSLGGAFGVVQRLYSIPWLSHGLPMVSAILVFGVLQFNAKVLLWAEEVIAEVSKVVWPSRKDTTAMTVVVCVFVGIASVLLIVIDYVAREFVQMIMSI
jgi:preprotein translocase subunit SecE